MMCIHDVCHVRPKCDNQDRCAPHPVTGASQICVKDPKCRKQKSVTSCEKYCKPNSCSNSHDCPHGLACINGKCQIIPSSNVCGTDYDCPHDKRCLGEDCVPKYCWNDDVCGPGYTCHKGMCITIGTRRCRNKRECKTMEHCINGRCTDFCNVHEDCRTLDGVCVKNRCTRPPSCEIGGETPCVEGLECKKGKCIETQVAIPCATDLDCDSGFYCKTDSVGFNGICSNACKYHHDCPIESICTINGCVKNECHHVSDEMCTELNMICKGGRCKKHCNNDFECEIAEFCYKNYCQRKECSSSSSCNKLSPYASCNKEKRACWPCPKKDKKCHFCSSVTDCDYKKGYACIFGVCQKCPGNHCTKCDEMSMICPKGYKCASGHCHPVICGSSIYDCPPGYSCSQGICIPIGTECSKLTPCKIRTDKCVHGRCLNVCQIFGTQNCKCSSFNQCTCKSSKDCDVGHLCRPKHGKNKYCTPATCKNDDDCDDGMVCSV